MLLASDFIIYTVDVTAKKIQIPNPQEKNYGFIGIKVSILFRVLKFSVVDWSKWTIITDFKNNHIIFLRASHYQIISRIKLSHEYKVFLSFFKLKFVLHFVIQE